MNINIKKYLTYILPVIGFIIVSLAYFYPVLKGEKMYQSDIAQFIGMAKQQIDTRNETGEELYWNDRAFAGMPTYQLGAYYPHHYIKKLDRALRFLPRPADYLFLYFIGFFILLCTLKIDPLLAFFGSLVFGFSTYFIIIIGVGHNAKAHAIGYFPLVLSGFLLVFQKKYIKGGLLFCVTLGLELVANHFQMTYYLFLLLLVIGITFLIKAIKEKTIPQFGISVAILLSGIILAVALNATSILSTREYAEFSTRGKSDLTINPDGSPKVVTNGLDKDYILNYSYGLLETFNLFIPRFMGGSSSEDAGSDAAIVKELTKVGLSYKEAKQFAKTAPTYWGEQPIIGAPAYIGAGIIFLFVLGLFLIGGYKKWWVVAGCLLALFLSYGKNMEWFSDLFINYFPLYSKFRAVTSIQVILELCVPLFGIYTLYQFLNTEYSEKEKLQALYKTTGVLGGLLLIFILFKNTLFSFSNDGDIQWIEQAGINFVDALREDRARMLTVDSIRSLIFVLLVAGVLWAFLKKKLKVSASVIAIGVILLIDLVPVAWRYVNADGFVPARQIDKPFPITGADKAILKDQSRYRVYDLSQGNPFNGGRTPFFHSAVGGYHGAKPKRMQNLFEFYIAKGEQSVLDMLNVKYFIFKSKEKGLEVQKNDAALGNAWFVETVSKEAHPDKEIEKLKKLNLALGAVVSDKSNLGQFNFKVDSLASIKLISEHPHELKYTSENPNNGFAVFSEMYYKKGWKAFINGEESEISKTNYALRGLQIPKGKNEITFKFEPQVVKTGSRITLIASILTLLLVAGGIVLEFKKKKEMS